MRARLIEVAAEVLRAEGAAALTTRGVAERAGVQAPTIYRLFGDKEGLLDAVTEQVMAEFAAHKTAAVAAAGTADADPVEDLRAGWEMTFEFGIANPDLYVLLSDPARARRSPATQAGIRLLADRVHRVALAGRLAIAEERAVELIHAAGAGAVLSTLARPVGERDGALSATMLDAVLAQVLTAAVATSAGRDVTAPAIALRARAAELTALSDSERALLTEWLDRVVAGS